MRMMIAFCMMAFLSAAVYAQVWPESPDQYPADARIDKPIYASIDITDDMWRSQSRFSQKNMTSLMQYLAKLGITRVYWVRAPEYTWSDWLVSEEGTPADAERMVVQAAHEAGMECYALYKPFETGVLTSIFPQIYPFPETIPTIETQSGRLLRAAPFIIEHPEYRIQRRPLQVDPHQPVKTIKLVKSDDAVTRLKAQHLEIWTSHNNGNFTKWNETPTFADNIERREAKNVRVLTLGGLNIPVDQRYIMVRTRKPETAGDKPFANVPVALMELYGEGNTLLPGNGDDGAIPRSALMESIITLCVHLHGHGRVPADMALTESYGTSPETSSFHFGLIASHLYGSSPVPERVLENNDGYIVVAKGKEMSMPAPHPIYPEVRAYWLSEIKTMMENGFDGIDIRIDSHSTWLAEASEYGFNEPIVAAYKEKYGVDILKEKFDAIRWRKLQGDSYTLFIREARELTRSQNRPLHLHVNGVWANVTPGFDLNNLPRTIEWQWERWITEDLCDGIHLKLLPWPWGSYRGKGQEFAIRAINLARKHGKSVSADARIQKWKLTTTEEGAVELTADDIAEVVDSLKWSWRSKSIDSINLYEVFDFVHIDLPSGKVYGSPAFEEILNAVRSNGESTLKNNKLKNWVTIETPPAK